MLFHNRVIFHELQLVRYIFRVLTSDVVVSSSSFRHQTDENAFPFCHFDKMMNEIKSRFVTLRW